MDCRCNREDKSSGSSPIMVSWQHPGEMVQFAYLAFHFEEETSWPGWKT
jgi:hypothetical protein